MRTVKEVSKLTGVSIRTLHYYDSIGLLLCPTRVTESGYRLYDDTALERLQLIMLFRELQFPLKEIQEILDNPGFDSKKALGDQIVLLEMRRAHIGKLIDLARGIQMIGVNALDFSAFDTKKIDDYAEQAKATWGATEAYKEFEGKTKDRTQQEWTQVNAAFMEIFQEFAVLRDVAPEEARVQAAVAKLRQFITDHFYTCTPEILQSLGQMYAGGGSMTQTIDRAGGEGTAAFASKAIETYCKTNSAQ